MASAETDKKKKKQKKHFIYSKKPQVERSRKAQCPFCPQEGEGEHFVSDQLPIKLEEETVRGGVEGWRRSGWRGAPVRFSWAINMWSAGSFACWVGFCGLLSPP